MNSIMRFVYRITKPLVRLHPHVRELEDHRYRHDEVADWLFFYRGRERKLTLTEFVARRREGRSVDDVDVDQEGFISIRKLSGSF
jgi:hypothetical protein